MYKETEGLNPYETPLTARLSGQLGDDLIG